MRIHGKFTDNRWTILTERLPCDEFVTLPILQVTQQEAVCSRSDGNSTQSNIRPPPQNDRLHTILRVEQMEDRVVPDARIVTALGDTHIDGKLTLREAVEQLNILPAGDHTITFSQDIQGGTITLDPAAGKRDLKLTKENTTLTINGSENFMTISRDPNAQQQHRLFTTSANTTLNLENLGLSHGAEVLGGAIYSIGDLSVQNCTLRLNTATDAGGAIYTNGGGNLSIFDSTITQNGASKFGGGINISDGGGFVGIYNSSITQNSAQWGGGISIFGSVTQNATPVVLDHVEVAENHAQNWGGGIYVHQAIGAGTDLTLMNTTWIHHNWVTNPDPTEDTQGGGIYFGKGTLFAISVTIGFNEAKTGDGMYRVNGTTLVGMPIYEGGDQGTVGP
ncbi:MAG: hypothetical protein L0241_03780 [Planctomycetia bacterium]|nr:hypothetical protein [Planctomycetia bacterium]